MQDQLKLQKAPWLNIVKTKLLSLSECMMLTNGLTAYMLFWETEFTNGNMCSSEFRRQTNANKQITL